ncbi:ABC transporter ATP-binding protein [Novosphingobium flavum]|uniref:ABC transporter ATP-binding protein n=1 Tax=Novosphingobium flavum TaxID=1778672 RepID=A0A7X1FQ93_9SPHN|nr:ABC transporter ATP-binding protein [Novosphingobium flavum]
MLSVLNDLYRIVRPSGLKRLVAVLAVTFLQAVVQTVAVFSLMPFLSAVADVAAFRRSFVGRSFVGLVGEGSDNRLMLIAGSASLALLVFGNLLSLFAEHHRNRYAFTIAQDLRTSLTAQILARRYSYFLGVNSSVLLKHLMDDAGRVASEIALPALDLASRTLVVLLMAVSVLFVEPSVIVVGAVVVLLFNLFVMKPIRKRALANSNTIMLGFRRLHFELFQTLGGVKQVIASDRKDYFVNRVSQASEQLTRAMARVPLYAAMPRSGFEVLVFGGMIVWVLSAIMSGENLTALMPRIGFIAIVAYRMMPSLQIMFAQAAMINSAQQALAEVMALIAEQPAFSADPARPADVLVPGHADRLGWSRHIRFENVVFRYDGADEPAIRHLDLTIAKGQRVAFVGSTGSGKSTLIDLLIGLLTPTSGRILIDDVPLTYDNMHLWRQAMGYVPQELFLLDSSIAENVAFGCEADEVDRARVLRAAEIAQARDFVETGQAEGFDTVVGERGVRLSGGQRQRLALARALYFEPNVLILDEATSALDPVTERKVTEALRRDSADMTVITVAHRIGTVRDYDVIHYMEHGRILFSGDYDSLIATQERFRGLVSNQH